MVMPESYVTQRYQQANVGVRGHMNSLVVQQPIGCEEP